MFAPLVFDIFLMLVFLWHPFRFRGCETGCPGDEGGGHHHQIPEALQKIYSR